MEQLIDKLYSVDDIECIDRMESSIMVHFNGGAIEVRDMGDCYTATTLYNNNTVTLETDYEVTDFISDYLRGDK